MIPLLLLAAECFAIAAAVTVPPLARMMPSTRAERAAHEKNRKALDDLPF